MSGRMIDRLSKDQLDAILNALPIEFIFVDENDCLQYCNKAERQAQMSQREVLGRRKAGGAGAHDGDALLIYRFQGLNRLTVLGIHVISNEALYALDVEGSIEKLTVTGGFARMGANTPADARKRVVELDGPHGIFVASLANQR